MSVSAVGCPGQVSGRQPRPDHQRTDGGRGGKHRGHGHSSGPRPAAISGDAATADEGRRPSRVSMVGCPAGMAPRGHAWTPSVLLLRKSPDRSAVAVRHTTKFRTPHGRSAASGAHAAVRWLREPVTGLAAAGGMQPAPVGASKPRGQPATQLAADVGHRRSGKGAGLLKAEIVNLQAADLAIPPAADDRLGDLVGVDADLGPGVVGQARSSQVRSATNTSSPGCRSGWPVSSW
jgi:hypothetical protein